VPWLWQDFRHYASSVRPVVLHTLQRYNELIHGSLSARVSRLAIAAHDLDKRCRQLDRLDLHKRQMPGEVRAPVNAVHDICIDLVDAGERMLALHCPLATSDYAYGFLHQHDILSHWKRYAASKRIIHEVRQLVADSNHLIEGYHWFEEQNNNLLVDDLDIPCDLQAPFVTARDLFSVAQDELALFSASRGLELVLRRIARRRGLRVRTKSKLAPAADLSFHDLIELFYRMQWHDGGGRVISSSFRALLHYLRRVRNEVAHADEGGQALLKPRETALLVTTGAVHLWQRIARSKSRFRSGTIERAWSPSDI